MTSTYIRGNVIWLSYYVEGKRIQKSTKLKNTPSNLKIVTSKIIPALDLKIATGDIYKKKPKTFEYYGDIYIKSKEDNKSYFSKVDRWRAIIDVFRGRDIDTITRLDIKQYLQSLPIKSKSKIIYKSCLKEIFEFAIDDEAISSNPALSIRLKPDEKKDIEYYSKEEVRLLIDNAYNEMFRVYLLIAFHTGMRAGEILGLQLNDFKDDHIDIQRTRSRGVVGTGKTDNAKRKIPYPKFLHEEAKKIQPKDSIFLFGSIDDSLKLRRHWRHTVKDANVKRCKLYATRHTFATLMLKDKVVSINELAGLLGHSSTKVTLEHYASVIESKSIDLGINFNLYCDTVGTVSKSS